VIEDPIMVEYVKLIVFIVDPRSVELTVIVFIVRFEVVMLLILILEVVMLEFTVSIFVITVEPTAVE
jgi:hypothetical protein